jgi:hypothetical protein
MAFDRHSPWTRYDIRLVCQWTLDLGSHSGFDIRRTNSWEFQSYITADTTLHFDHLL